MLGNGIREIPDDRTGLGIAKGVASMHLHHHTLDTAGHVRLPVLAFSRLLFHVGEIIPPPQLLEQYVVKLGVARGDFRAL
ncbi:hypothetical protein D3C71_2106320 [compost metagenome]